MSRRMGRNYMAREQLRNSMRTENLLRSMTPAERQRFRRAEALKMVVFLIVALGIVAICGVLFYFVRS